MQSFEHVMVYYDRSWYFDVQLKRMEKENWELVELSKSDNVHFAVLKRPTGSGPVLCCTSKNYYMTSSGGDGSRSHGFCRVCHRDMIPVIWGSNQYQFTEQTKTYDEYMSKLLEQKEEFEKLNAPRLE